MGRNKAQDDNLFDCSSYDEKYYVAKQYDDYEGVMKFIEDKCASKDIYHSNHAHVYQLINDAGYKKKA